jgi:hypothetical protein
MIGTIGRPGPVVRPGGRERAATYARVDMAATVDPRTEVEAPIRRALGGLVVRSAVSFGGAVVAVLVSVQATQGALHVVGHVALPLVLGVVLLARGARVALRGSSVPTEDAWSRVRAIEPGETAFATFVASSVPLAWLVGGGAIIARHTSHHELAAVVAVWLPLALALWFLATIAWVHDGRDRLARGLDESDRRFRAYWTRPGTV